MKCAVSGANGFLGGHLCKKLELLGHTVYKISRDLLDSHYLTEIILKDLGEPDYIFHLSAFGNHSYQQDVEQTIKANIANTFYLLRKLNQFKYKAFINVGSSSEYGRKGSCMKEDMVLNPDTFYAATKAAGTHLARAFAKQYDKPIITVRPFSVYGPGEAYHRFIPTVIRKLRDQEPIEVCEGEHDWIHVSDVVDAMIALLPHADKHKGEVFNIGTGEAYTNGFVIQTLEKLLGKKTYVKHTEQMRPWDSGVWCADIAKIRSVIGTDYRPRHIITGLKELLNETIESK